ncbi:uncharacterized protein [Malus domestica]|uniref:uncharacterized protein isoform X2 n=1 Tax=Malus domestica TaxID=3750 RepID=UPI00397519EB
MKLNNLQTISDFDPKIRSCIGLWRLLLLLPNYSRRSFRIQKSNYWRRKNFHLIVSSSFQSVKFEHFPLSGMVVAKVFDCRHGDCQELEGSAALDFLLEQKRKEQETLVKEQAERERQAEEQRRIEAVKAASDADRAHAKAEILKRRQMVQELIKKGCKICSRRLAHRVWRV